MADSKSETVLDDEMAATLAALNEAVEADVPDSVKAVDDGDTEEQGKASKAFIKLKEQTKTALQIIEQQRAVNEQLRKEREEKPPEAPTPSPNAEGNSQTQDLLIFNALAQRACATLQIANRAEAPHMFDLEVARLYGEQRADLERRNTAKEKAPTFVDSVLEGIEALSDEDRAAVKQRVSKLDLLQQMDQEVIRQQASTYLGERLLSGDYSPSGNGHAPAGEGDEDGTGRPSADLISGGSTGVQPGVQHRRKPAVEKPATAEELDQMKAIGATDLKAFRASKALVRKYRTM